MPYYHNRVVKHHFDTTITLVTEALDKEGFGILTQINMTQKFKQKLGIEFRNYVILGACHPSLAFKSLQIEDKIGVMLPCNVIIQDLGLGQVEIAAIDPVASMAAIDNPDLLAIAAEVSAKLKNAVHSV